MIFVGRLLLLCAFLFLLSGQGYARLSFNSLPEGKFEELQEVAQLQQLPFLVYFFRNDDRRCKRMEKQTWSDQELMKQLNKHFLTQQHHLLQAHTELIQQYHVYHTPTILIFDPDGKLMGRLEGYVTPETLWEVAQKHLGALKQMNPPPKDPVDHAAQAVFATMEEEKNSHPLMAARGSMVNSIHLMVPGMEAYSLKNLEQGEEGLSIFAVLLGRFSSFREIKLELRRMERFWRGRIWVFAEQTEEGWEYRLAVGAYPDATRARNMVKAIRNLDRMDAELINLSRLVP